MSDQLIRLTFFITGLVGFSLLEFLTSYRQINLKRVERWPANLALIAVGTLLVKIVLPSGLIFLSDYIQHNQWGFLNFFNFNSVVLLVFTLALMDFSIYIQHIIFHKIGFFWRFHRVHHADIDLDTTSALRFHPIEILFSIFYKIIVILLLGASAESIFIFEILLNFTAMFNHSNIKLPKFLETLIRLIIVTPQMHIVHHSVLKEESDTNYGFNFSFWDRLFHTYQADFKGSDLVGQEYYRSANEHGILALLALPFKPLKLLRKSK